MEDEKERVAFIKERDVVEYLGPKFGSRPEPTFHANPLHLA